MNNSLDYSIIHHCVCVCLCVCVCQLGYTALMYGVKQDDVCIVSELLLAGADPTIRNKVHVHTYSCSNIVS